MTAARTAAALITAAGLGLAMAATAPVANAAVGSSASAAATSAPSFVVTGKAGLAPKKRTHLRRTHSTRAARLASTSSSRRSVTAGTVTATLTFASRCAPMTLTLTQSGATLARKSGASPVVAAVLVATGSLTTKVTGSSCKTSYKVSIVNTPMPEPQPGDDPAPTPAPAPADEAPAALAPATAGVSPLSFGAVGNGIADDTAAVQKAIGALSSGDTLLVPAGYTFAHRDVLAVRTPGVRVSGGGILLATNEARSALLLDADDVQLDNVTLRVAATTQRWETYEQMKLRLGRRTGITVSDVVVDGSAAAGVYVGGASNFVLRNVTVQNTRADGIHMTEASSYGQVVRPVVRNVGDDGVAVVSYASNGSPVHHVTVTSPRFYGQTWGRAFSVVGGEDITFTDVYAEHSQAAAIYIAAEASWNTLAAKRVLVDGGTVISSNEDSAVDHGAVLVFSGQTAYTNTDITVRNLTVRNTRTSASRQLGVVSDGNAAQQRIAFRNITIVGGPQSLVGSNAPASSMTRTGWTYNGSPVADVVGWV